MDIVEKIAADIANASKTYDKSAMFHYSVLVHADELHDIDPAEFCKEVGVPKSYATEFRKMIKVAELLQAYGNEDRASISTRKIKHIPMDMPCSRNILMVQFIMH